MLLEKEPLKQSSEICEGNANNGDDGDGREKKKLHNIITWRVATTLKNLEKVNPCSKSVCVDKQ